MYLIDFVFHDSSQLTPELTQAHRNYLKPHYESQQLLFGGPKVPRTGGFILSQHRKPDEIQMILNEDPLIKSGIASYSILEFRPLMAAADYLYLIDAN